MIPDVMLSVPQSVNPLNAILHVRNPKTQSVTSNVKDPIAKSCVPKKHVKLKIAPNVSPSVNLLTVLLIAKFLNPNVKQFVKNPNVIGNVTNPNAPNPNVNLFVKTPLADLKSNAVNVMPMEPHLKELCSSKKLNLTPLAVNAMEPII
jgi:hypothetical protein